VNRFKILLLISLFLSLLISLASICITLFHKKNVKIVSPIVKNFKPLPTPIILNLEQIYQDSINNLNSSYQPKSAEITIVAVGDVILARSVNSLMVKNNNFKLPFEKTVSILKNHDLLFMNFESPLLADCQPTNEGMIFCGNEKAVEGLNFVHTDVVNLANNHFQNYGEKGETNTIRLLQENKIDFIGLENQPVIKTLKEKTFGFLGFDDVTTKIDNEDLRLKIEDLKKKVDFVIVYFHWGEEYTAQASERQKELAYLAIDAGADLILGSHPHWIQKAEIYKQKLIVYSFGNFVFDQMWSEKTKQGLIGKFVFNNQGLNKVFFYPVVIENYSQPRPANKEEGGILQNLFFRF